MEVPSLHPLAEQPSLHLSRLVPRRPLQLFASLGVHAPSLDIAASRGADALPRRPSRSWVAALLQRSQHEPSGKGIGTPPATRSFRAREGVGRPSRRGRRAAESFALLRNVAT